MKYIMLCGLFFLGINAYACPFKITNDTEHEIFIADGNMYAIHIGQQQTSIINPIIQGKFLGIISYSWFIKEKLHIYQQLENSNTFYKHFLLIEKYCSDDPKENQFRISDIETLPASFIKRFNVVTYPMPKESFIIPSRH